MEPNQERRRGHFHRGRRGPDRRGPDRRTQPPGPPRDQVNVEQIMREIRTRVAQRHGVELSSEQIHDLAARRLESILDPRSIRPSLLEGLRRSAGATSPAPTPRTSSEPVYTFEDTTLYDSHRAILRFVRKLLNPVLKLFFNPNPLIRALHLQAQLNVEAAAREAERDRRQAEWNALHYEILQRLVTEVSRVSLESQALSARAESLDARVDFSDRRVRSLEGTLQHARPAARAETGDTGAAPETAGSPETMADGGALDGTRRRRRRRRSRRPGGGPVEAGANAEAGVPEAEPGGATQDGEPDEPSMATSAEAAAEPAAAVAPQPPAEPNGDASNLQTEPAAHESAGSAVPAHGSRGEPERSEP